MHLRLVVISAICLSLCVVPATSTSLLAAAAGAKGILLGAGLAALKTSGGSETVIVQAESGSGAEVVPSHQVVVHDPVLQYQPAHKPQTVTYTIQSSSPFSRLWDAITAKTKAIGNLFSPPNRVVIVNIPPSTESTSTTTTTTTTPKTTTKKPHKPIIEFEVEASVNPHGQRLYPVSVVNYVKK